VGQITALTHERKQLAIVARDDGLGPAVRQRDDQWMRVVVETLQDDVRIALDEGTIARRPVGAIQVFAEKMKCERPEWIAALEQGRASEARVRQTDVLSRAWV
jgi:hypothetical protein